jgi:hypothetical protein
METDPLVVDLSTTPRLPEQRNRLLIHARLYLRPVTTSFDRDDLERLRDDKRSRNFYRLESVRTVQHEFRGQFGHPSSYAYVRFECAPADDLSFEARVSWPPSALGEGPRFERVIAESVADELLAGVYQHSGCAVTLVEIRYDEVGSSEAAFMRAAKAAMQDLLGGDWEIVIRSRK